MASKVNQILLRVLENVQPSNEDLKSIEYKLKNFLVKLKKDIKKRKIKADVFIGGSYAKNTLIKKDHYDIDLFIRFNKQYKDEISAILEKVLGKQKDMIKVHGSRDYFRIKISDVLYFELIPVKKISKPKEAVNITDLSYSHVRYINKKIKSKKILDDIRIAKAFCHANNCYGAESYINGFSGYSIELLIYHYKGFLNFLKAVIKMNPEERYVIDIEKRFKNKNHVLMDINTSKLQSPIILIDPTYKQRNALAALSKETFERFQKAARDFLKNPSVKNFEQQIVDINKIKEDARKKKFEFILLEVKTEKQEGDVAGTKLLKFYNHLSKEIEVYFEIKKKGFNYDSKQSAKYFFVVKPKKDVILEGPFLNDIENAKSFRKKHTDTFEKKGKIYAKKKIDFSLKNFIDAWKYKNKKKIKEMCVGGLKVIG
jgi:tRNA CCA-adding enzyme